MIELISIHLPKTAGTSFYDILRQVYSNGLSPGYKRRDLYPVEDGPCVLAGALDPGLRALHGHFTWREVASHHTPGETKVITWLRDPVDRVISNYQFFIDRLKHPDINPEVARLNTHRRQESLLEYARLEENRNRMSRFLEGLAVEDCFFIGFMESFEADVTRLGRLLGWSAFTIQRLNTRPRSHPVSTEERRQIEELNREDRALYEEAKSIFFHFLTFKLRS